MKSIYLLGRKIRNRIRRLRRSQAWAVMVGVLAAYTIMALFKVGIHFALYYVVVG